MDGDEWTWELEKTIPSSKDVAHAQVELLINALTEAGWDGSDLFHVQMSVDEAIMNAVIHGNEESPDKQVDFVFRVSEKAAYVQIRDQGCGFCLEEVPDPTAEENLESIHGRGVFLIQQMMSEVTYNEVGNEVTMVKYRKQA